jgi:hypothetical protein
MQLLVSVTDAEEAAAALAGGADIVDAKEPRAGALGAVTPAMLRHIRAVIGSTRTLTAAVGDAQDEESTERSAFTYRTAGAAFVKIGFAGTATSRRASALIEAAVRGAAAGVIAVAYADSNPAGSPPPEPLIEAAARGGAAGILLDTADKDGPGVRDLFSPGALTSWVAAAHGAGLLVAVAGKLTADDLSFARDAGADIAGVRGAACEGGRRGRVSIRRVRLLSQLCRTNSWQLQSNPE